MFVFVFSKTLPPLDTLQRFLLTRGTHSRSMSDGRFLGTSSKPFLEQSAVAWSQEHSHGHLTLSVRSFRSSPRAPGPRAATTSRHRTRAYMTAARTVRRAAGVAESSPEKRATAGGWIATDGGSGFDASPITLASKVRVARRRPTASSPHCPRSMCRGGSGGYANSYDGTTTEKKSTHTHTQTHVKTR